MAETSAERENSESVLYEANIVNSENIDKEKAALNAKESRLEDLINQMVTVEAVSVEISENSVKIYIQTGENTRLSDEQQVNIKDSTRRFVSDAAEIILDVGEYSNLKDH